MKVRLTRPRPKSFLWHSFFLLVFLLFSISSLQAQDYVSSSIAKTRLADRAIELDAQVEQGTISQIDYSINIKFLKIILDDIGNHDFDWSTEHANKITGVYGDALNTAHADALQAFPQYTNKVNTIKEEMNTLLQQ